MTAPSAPPDQAVRLLLPQLAVECYAGTPLEFTVPVLQGLEGDPVAASAISSARAQVRLRWESPDVLHSWTTDDPDGMEIVGTTAAGVHIIATGAETATWQQQWPRLAAWWDLEVVDVNGAPHRLCRTSPFIVNPEITREL